MSAHLKLAGPHIFRSVPNRPANAAFGPAYLTLKEVERLSKARDGCYGQRDAALILIAFRHVLRAPEIADLEWSHVEFGQSAALHIRRTKNGKPSFHILGRLPLLLEPTHRHYARPRRFRRPPAGAILFLMAAAFDNLALRDWAWDMNK